MKNGRTSIISQKMSTLPFACALPLGCLKGHHGHAKDPKMIVRSSQVFFLCHPFRSPVSIPFRLDTVRRNVGKGDASTKNVAESFIRCLGPFYTIIGGFVQRDNLEIVCNFVTLRVAGWARARRVPPRTSLGAAQRMACQPLRPLRCTAAATAIKASSIAHTPCQPRSPQLKAPRSDPEAPPMKFVTI